MPHKKLNYALILSLILFTSISYAQNCHFSTDVLEVAYEAQAQTNRKIELKNQTIGCRLEVYSDSDWIIPQTTSVTSNGTVYFQLTENTSSQVREGHLIIGDKKIAIKQKASGTKYLFLLQGEIPNGEGKRSHELTIDRICQKAKSVNLLDQHIYRLGSQQASQHCALDAIASKATIQNQLAQLKQAYLSSPSPIFFTMVGHGDTAGNFYLGAEQLSPAELNSYLATFEQGIDLQTRLQNPLIIIIGACYSGQFISALSNPGRLIITSTSATGLSFKGPVEDRTENDTLRSGELFIDELFSYLAQGNSLHTAFQLAAKTVRAYTREALVAIPTPFKGAAQIPRIEDDGDGRSFPVANVIYPDQIEPSPNKINAKQLFLGTPANTMPEYMSVFQNLKPLKTQYLTPETTTAELSIDITSNFFSPSAYTAIAYIRPPNQAVPQANSTTGAQTQLEMPPQQVMLYCQDKHCRANGEEIFTQPGKYEIFYFLRHNNTSEISPLQRSVIYKTQAGNSKPTTFSLLQPAPNSKVRTGVLLEWEDSQDENNPVTYNVIIGTEKLNEFELAPDSIIYRKQELTVSMLAISQASNILLDQTHYFWQVEAVNMFGERRKSNIFSFHTDNPNAAACDAITAQVPDTFPLERINVTTLRGEALPVKKNQFAVCNESQAIVNTECFKKASFSYQQTVLNENGDAENITVALSPANTWSPEGHICLSSVNIEGLEKPFKMKLLPKMQNLFSIADYQELLEKPDASSYFTINDITLRISNLELINAINTERTIWGETNMLFVPMEGEAVGALQMISP